MEQDIQLACVLPESDINVCFTDAYVDGRQPGMAPMALYHSPEQTHSHSYPEWTVCFAAASVELLAIHAKQHQHMLQSTEAAR